MQCFCCHRDAARYDRQIEQWVCEGSSDCSMSMRRARTLELEHPCECCNARPSTGTFDRQFVCERCRRAKERKLALHG